MAGYRHEYSFAGSAPGLTRSRACPQIAFCKMPSQFASDFMLDLGGVVGYIDQIQRKIWCEVGRQIAGMNLGTRSSTKIRRNACRTFIIFAVSKDADDEISSTQKLYPEKASLFNSYFRISIYRHFLYNLFYIQNLLIKIYYCFRNFETIETEKL